MTKTLRLALAATTALIALPLSTGAGAQTLPTGGTIGSGSATISQPDANTMNIGVASSNAIINWNSFNVGTGRTVNFANTSGGQAAVLNRVTGATFSNIDGNINGPANLDIYLINTNGIVFGTGANVNVGGLIASTLDITDADFNEGGSVHFSGLGSAGITSSGGSIATSGKLGLISGRQISVQNTAISAGGDVAIVTGQDVMLAMAPGSPLSITINRGVAGSGRVDVGQVSGRNVTIAAAAQAGVSGSYIQLFGNVTATSASATDRGIVLAAGASAAGVQMAYGTGTETAGNVNFYTPLGVTIRADQTQASDTAGIAVAANGNINFSGSMIAADNLNIDTAPGWTAFLLDDSSFTSTSGTLSLTGSLYAMGNATFQSAGDMTFDGVMDGSGDFTASAASGDIRLTGPAQFRDIRLTGENIQGTEINAARDLTATATDGDVTFSTSTIASRNATISASNLIQQNFVMVGGDYSITAGDFSGGFNPTLTGLASNFTITDTAYGLTVGNLSAPGTLSINTTNGGNLSQVAGGALTAGSIVLSASGSLALSGSIAATSNVALQVGSTLSQDYGSSITAQSLSGAAGSGLALLGTNYVSVLTGLDSGSSNLTFYNYRTLTVTGDVRAADGTSVILGAIGATSDLIIDATAGGHVSAGFVNLSAERNLDAQSFDAVFDATLQAGNIIDLGASTVGRDLTASAVDWTADALDNLTATRHLRILDKGGGFSTSGLSAGGNIEIYVEDGLLNLSSGGTGLRSGSGDVILTHAIGSGGINLSGGISGRDIKVTSNSVWLGSSAGLIATRDISISGTTALTGPASLTAGETITFGGMVDQAGGLGPLTLTSGNGTTFNANVGSVMPLHSLIVNGGLMLGGTLRTVGNATFRGDVASTLNVDITSLSGAITIAGNVYAAGNYLLRGRSISLGNGSAVTQAAAGRVDITSTSGAIAGAAGLTLRANTDGVGTETLILDANGGNIEMAGTSLQGGPNRQSRIGIRLGTSGASATFGDVSARGFSTAYLDHISIFDNYSSTGDLTVGNLSVVNPLYIDSMTVDIGNITSGGDIAIYANGSLTTGNVAGQGVWLQGASLSAGSATAMNGPVALTARSGSLSTAGLTSTGDMTLLAGGAVQTGDVSAGGTLTVDADGAVTLGAASNGQVGAAGAVAIDGATVTTRGHLYSSGGTVSLAGQSGPITTGSISAADEIQIEGQGITAGAVSSGSNIRISGNGDKTIGSLVAQDLRGAGYVVIDGTGDVVIGDGVTAINAAGELQIGLTTQPDSVTANGSIAAGQAYLMAGRFDVDDVTTVGDMTLLASSGDISFGTLSAPNVALVISAAADGDIAGGAITGDNVRLLAGDGTIEVTGPITTPLLEYAGSNAVFSGANRIAVLAGSTGGLTLNNIGALHIEGTLFGDANNVTIATTGDLTLGAGAQVRGHIIGLSAGGRFVNQRGADVLLAGNRWAVYLNDPAGHDYGGLNSGNTAMWNATMATLAPNSVPGSRYVFAYQPTLTVTTTGASKVYGDILLGMLGGMYELSGFHEGVDGAFLADTADTVFSGGPTITSAGAAAHADVAGGPYIVTGSQAGMTLLNGYRVVFVNDGRISVSPKTIAAAVSASSKTYDGNRTGGGTVTLNGTLAGDDVGTSGATFTFADKNAGNGKAVAVTGVTLTGADAGNYTLTVPASVLADILKKEIGATATANDKTYDGTNAGSGSLTLSGAIDGDDVKGGAVFTFADKNAGRDKTVALSGGELAGADAGNYTLTLPAAVLADILRKEITASAVANNKVYDGVAAGTGAVTLSGVVDGDDVGGSALFTFADKNAGTGKTVTVSGGALVGADAGNYTLTLPTSVLADIFKKEISASARANSKTYDGTTDASGSIMLAGVVGGDDVEGSAVFTFADRNAAAGKTVTLSGGTLTGADAGNYTLTLPATVLADILRRAITVTAADARKEKGQADPTFAYAVTSGSLVAGDSLAGALARGGGELPGSYAITQGSLAASSNYQLTFVGGTLVIDPGALPPPPPPEPQPVDPTQDLAGYVASAVGQVPRQMQTEAVLFDASGAFCGVGGGNDAGCPPSER